MQSSVIVRILIGRTWAFTLHRLHFAEQPHSIWILRDRKQFSILDQPTTNFGQAQDSPALKSESDQIPKL